MYFDHLLIRASCSSREWNVKPCKWFQTSEVKGKSPPVSMNSEGRFDSNMASDCEQRGGCHVAGEESAARGSCISGTAATSTASSAPGSGYNAPAEADVSATDLSLQQLKADVSEMNDCTAHDTCISCVGINNLPDEILIKIFSYMSFCELIDVVQNVSSRWERVSRDVELWADKEYEIWHWNKTNTHTCKCDQNDQEVIRTLCKAPSLRKVVLHRPAKFRVFRTLYNKCHQLTELRIQCMQKLSDPMLKNLIEKCSKLQTLVISNELLKSEEIVEAVSQLQHLRVLKLENNRSKVIPRLRPLADGCPQLLEVDFGSVTVVIDELRYFLNAKKNTLKSICIKWTMVGKRCIVPLLTVCADTLERLQLYNYKVIHDEVREAFTALGSMKNLKELRASIGHHPLPPPGLATLPFKSGGLQKVELLDMCGGDGLTDDVLIVICHGCPALRELLLTYNDQLSDAGFSQIHCLQNLEILDISGCKGLGGAVIPCLSSLPQLHTLRMEWLNLQKLRPGLSSIFNLSSLRCLRLDHAIVTGMPFRQFPSKLINLRDLHVYGCQGNSKAVEAIGVLTKRMPDLKIHGIIVEMVPTYNAEDHESDEDNVEEENEEQADHEDGGNNAEQHNEEQDGVDDASMTHDNNTESEDDGEYDIWGEYTCNLSFLFLCEDVAGEENEKQAGYSA